MQEATLSARRSSPNPDDGGSSGGNDESKTRKPSSIAVRLAKNLYIKLPGGGGGGGPNAYGRGHCLLVSFLIFAVLVLASILIFRSRSNLCVSPYDSLPRMISFFGDLDGLASDFGSLGVPWCKIPDLELFETLSFRSDGC